MSYTTNIPLNGTIEITAAFNEVNADIWKTAPHIHRGVDLIGSTTIYSPCDGVVRVVNYDANGWGYYVSIGDDDGIHRHILCHMKKGSIKVSVGQKVNRLTVIGTMGNTGNVTGTHLHYQINKVVNGKTEYIDPCKWMGIPNKRGKYDSSKYLSKTWEQINAADKPATTDYKVLYDAEVKSHAETKTALKTEQDKAVKLSKDLAAANSKISAAKAALQ